METDALQRLLRAADADAGPPPRMPDGLSSRVLQRVKARRARRVLLRSAAALILLAVGASVAFWPRGVKSAGVELPAAQAARWQAEADWRAAVARRTETFLARQSRAAALRKVAAQPDPVQAARAQVERAASILLQQGDTLSRQFGLPQQAAASYQEILRLFPKTVCAGLARERLTELKGSLGGES